MIKLGEKRLTQDLSDEFLFLLALIEDKAIEDCLTDNAVLLCILHSIKVIQNIILVLVVQY